MTEVDYGYIRGPHSAHAATHPEQTTHVLLGHGRPRPLRLPWDTRTCVVTRDGSVLWATADTLTRSAAQYRSGTVYRRGRRVPYPVEDLHVVEVGDPVPDVRVVPIAHYRPEVRS